jgi:RNA polymerase sigma-70 factor, ECF subfamily
VAVAVFVSQSSREGPLTAVTARGGRGVTRFPASGLMTRAAWLVPARDGGPGTHEPGSGPGEATPDQELVRRGQRGDLEAFDELMRRHLIRAYHVALAVLHDHHDAQDTVQDAFLAAWRGLAGFRGDCEFGTWLHPIITRLALNKASRRRYTVSLDQVSPTAGTYAGPAETAERAAASRSVRAAVRTLPAAQRSAITLHYLDGLSYARIAALTRTTIPAVRSHLFRGRRTLAASLGNWR